MSEAFFALHHDLPRQGPGSDATTRLLLALAGPLPDRPRALDIGCGPGRSALVLAEAGAEVTAVDTHEPFLDQLRRSAVRRGLRVTAEHRSMTDLPYPDASFDLVWAEGSAYLMGFDQALSAWRRLLAPGGALVVTECGWTTLDPAPAARAFWDAAYPLRTTAQTITAATRAGYTVTATYLLPDRDWFDEYYAPLERRADAADPALPGMAEALAWTRREIDLRRAHGADYGYTGYVLRPRPTTP
ncbi:class I SAM-dependent methyltransferase [Saccharothrix coeruleofusca]|uniref:Methyltransferase type 11 n=1 Tax=Saccharothrix coeruleofusca TaxID=33919 RepID=A0A918AU60_9PSEU|nr:class I SAM-dependent methyltransferase [Saccharothrix coeruleofusca]GGP86191.1 methyltransferase type 11 [Saccharothrix coeruleofusca]